MLQLKWIFIATLTAGFTTALTGCPNPIDSQTARERETAKYAGVWVRAVDYCEYMNTGYGPRDYRCDDVQWEDNNSIAAMDDAWLIVAIDRQGGINSFGLRSGAANNGNWGLGYITEHGYYVGYLTTANSNHHQDVIRVLVDGESLTLFTDAGNFTNRVAFLNVTEAEARTFEDGYFNCGKMGYCKGQHIVRN